MTNLSVNLNKVALLRNQRDIGYPELLDHGALILDAGADGLTIHPRPDERHIRKIDVRLISNFVREWNASHETVVELNIEGYPSDEFLDLVCAHDCDQVTLVPDDPNQRTSDHGWDIEAHKDRLSEIVARLHDSKRRVSIFIDPDPKAATLAKEIGADRVELYTGPYAFAWVDSDEEDVQQILARYRATAQAAIEAGLAINAGHDLSLSNLPEFFQSLPECAEVSIGHAITDEALKVGWKTAVNSYLKLCRANYED